MFGVGDFLSNLTLGAVADKVGARRLFAVAFFILSCLFFLWPACNSVLTLSTIAFFYGYFCCTISSMPIIILADAYGESSSEHILALNGITNLFKLPGYFLGPLLLLLCDGLS
jgi:MFS family permease